MPRAQYMMLVAFGCLAVVYVGYYMLRRQEPPTENLEHSLTCIFPPEKLLVFQKSVSIVFDFSELTRTDLRNNIQDIQRNTADQFIREILLIENSCTNAEAAEYAMHMAESSQNIKLIRIDSKGEKVSRGRARIEAVAHTGAPLLVFLSAGVIPEPCWLEGLLSQVLDTPSAVVVPSVLEKTDAPGHLSWSLFVKPSPIPFEDNVRELPLLDGSSFIIRAELYEAVGGYDKHIFKNDIADHIAFSLAVWLCGGSIVQSQLARVKLAAFIELLPDGVKHLPYAKYITEVFDKGLQDGGQARRMTYPGVEFYPLSRYESQAIESRRRLYSARQCLPLSWYAGRFPSYLPLKATMSRYYNENYIPEHPPAWELKSQEGRWFVLFVGMCVKHDPDGLLGMEWCPVELADHHRFIFDGKGQITNGQKCVTVDDTNVGLRMDTCKGDLTQKFTFNYQKKYVISQQTNQCATHVNGPEGRQILQLMDCLSSEPFNIFILSGRY